MTATGAKIVTKQGDRHTVWAVEFITDDKTFRTLWTKSEGEAKAWADIIRCHGWCMSGRPMEVLPPLTGPVWNAALKRIRRAK